MIPAGAAGDRERLRALLLERSVERRPVILASGAHSDFYIDCKQTALHPEGAAALGGLLLAAVARIEAAAGCAAVGVGGMTLGADPLATAVSLRALAEGRSLCAFIVRKTAKGHGTGAWIEGRRNLPDGSPVVVLEDVVTTGGTTLKALDHIREERLRPLGVVTVVDRGVGGLARLAAEGLAVEALFGPRDLELSE